MNSGDGLRTVHPWLLPQRILDVLVQCFEISDDIDEVIVSQANTRHQNSWFHRLWIAYPLAKCAGAVVDQACSDREPVCNVREIGAHAAERSATTDRMTAAARLVEDVLTKRSRCVRRGRCRLARGRTQARDGGRFRQSRYGRCRSCMRLWRSHRAMSGTRRATRPGEPGVL